MFTKNKPIKMKKVLFALAIVAAGMFASCGGNSGSEATAPVDSTAVVTETEACVDSAAVATDTAAEATATAETATGK
jgi:hypothetical protein